MCNLVKLIPEIIPVPNPVYIISKHNICYLYFINLFEFKNYFSSFIKVLYFTFNPNDLLLLHIDSYH
jgi:hypothetical protein